METFAKNETTEVIQALNNLLDKNMADFDAALTGMDKAEIAGMDDVAATREIYNFIRYDSEFDRHEAELLLRMENPLNFIVDNWPCYDLAALAAKHLESKAIQVKDTVAKKPSILEEIRASRREAHQQPVTEARAKGDEVR